MNLDELKTLLAAEVAKGDELQLVHLDRAAAAAVAEKEYRAQVERCCTLRGVLYELEALGLVKLEGR